ncbi:hypothetical protein DFH06DRAFT_1333485 [Mycena polygramma]|nr:hypothetical protein DFH06DRAFT_1333485 [Mycena polygramma]
MTRTYELVTPTAPTARRASWLRRLISRPKNTFQDVTAPYTYGRPYFRRFIRQGDEHVEIPLKRDYAYASRLTSLHIHSTILILPPGLSWTLEVLRSCPISHLTFSKMVLTGSIWSTVLPLIASAVPPLTSVAFIDLVFLPESEIMCFLAHFTNIVELTVLSQSDPTIVDTPSPHLPHLARIHAPAHIIRFLLSQDALPTLHAVTVVCLAAYVVPDLCGVVRMLSSVINAINAHPRTTAPELTLAMHLKSCIWWNDESWDDVPLTFRPSLDRVQRIEMVLSALDPADVTMIEDVVWGVAARVELFRRAVSAAVAFEPEGDVGTLPQWLTDNIKRTQFLHAVEVNGKEYSLTG